MTADTRHRRGAVARIDRAEFRSMVEAGHSTGEIAAHFGCSSPSVARICHAEGIPLPARRYRGGVSATQAQAEVEAPVKPIVVHPPRTAALFATGGRYADLAAWAREWGVTEIKARQEWHGLRLPVAKGAGG